MDKSFKEGVVKFWEAFSKEEAEIREMMDNKVEGETLLNFVDNILSIAFGKVYFEMGINNEGKYELILTPEGDRTRLLLLNYWLKMSPKYLWEKWNFYSTKPGIGKSDFGLTMFGISLDKSDVTIGYEADDEEKKINIQVYAPKLMALEENQRYSMFFILLDQFIGEINTMMRIGYIDFIEVFPEGASVAIDGFKEVVEKTVEEKDWLVMANPLDVYSGYRLEPNEEEGWILREDVYIGSTSCIPVMNSFLNRDEEVFEEFEKDGVVFGFLFYENINVSQEEMVSFRAEIEDKILEIAQKQHVADTIGGATGFHFSYMDFVIYDINAFLEIAKDVLSTYKMEETGFSRFIFGDQPIFF